MRPLPPGFLIAAAPTVCSLMQNWPALFARNSSKNDFARRSSSALFEAAGLPFFLMINDGCFRSVCKRSSSFSSCVPRRASLAPGGVQHGVHWCLHASACSSGAGRWGAGWWGGEMGRGVVGWGGGGGVVGRGGVC